MTKPEKYLIHRDEHMTAGLHKLNGVVELTLFVVNDEGQLIGTLTDGDVRRGLMAGKNLDDKVSDYMKTQFRYIQEGSFSVADIVNVRNIGIQILPVLDGNMQISRLINFSYHKSFLPLDAVIMAGGRGVRLSPLTDTIPKPLLKVGDRPIIEHGVRWLSRHGIGNITISVNYLAEQIVDHFGDGSEMGVSVSYIREKEQLGTIGSLSLIEHVHHDTVLLMNSDLLTNIDLEEFFNEFVTKGSDMSVACIPYNVNIPYAILEIDHESVLSLKEKPTLTYYSNAGIYLLKKEHIGLIPTGKFYNATDLIENLISKGRKVTYYPLLGYWLDIGKMDDFRKAQEDIKHIKF